MRRALATGLRQCVGMLYDPGETLERALQRPSPWIAGLMLAGLLVALGTATLPRQVPMLAAFYAPSGNPGTDRIGQLMLRGLHRLVTMDRIVPMPTLLCAALITLVGAEPVLMLPQDRRRALWTAILLGLSPLVVQRAGELLMTWTVPIGEHGPPGLIVELPHRFRTGPALLWRDVAPVPRWLETLDGTVNLVSLWSVGLWAAGLKRLDGSERLAGWHVTLPVVALAGGALTVWLLAPFVLGLLLAPP